MNLREVIGAFSLSFCQTRLVESCRWVHWCPELRVVCCSEGLVRAPFNGDAEISQARRFVSLSALGEEPTMQLNAGELLATSSIAHLSGLHVVGSSAHVAAFCSPRESHSSLRRGRA